MTRRWWRPAPVGVIVACLVTSVSLTACASARSDLGTSSSPCFVALPTADGAVHGVGRLVGVRLFTVASLRHQAPHAYDAAVSAGARGSDRVCLVAFEGRFTAAAVEHPRGRPAGKFAVVMVGYPATHLFSTVIFRKVPLRFGHFLSLSGI
ncbi:MAG: hypothetical protein ACLP9C_13995 [Acidimicrobiales bacterium]